MSGERDDFVRQVVDGVLRDGQELERQELERRELERAAKRVSDARHLASSQLLAASTDSKGLQAVMARSGTSGVWWSTVLEQLRHQELCSHLSSVVVVLQSLETAIVALGDIASSIEKTTVYVRGEPNPR